MKNISKISRRSSAKTLVIPPYHDVTPDDISDTQRHLLHWYDLNKRDLPWRKQDPTDINKTAYSVWVSEIMLQQTQVVTVINYYNNWMKKWPTLQHLAKADIEEINQVWSGLGYYSRARRLHEAAQKVVADLGGEMPTTCSDLQTLPGVGRYTASAVASIAFKQCVGVVDGNVVRVLSRFRAIGANSDDPPVMDVFWQLSTRLVSQDRPGDFNQSLMELGATVCTPKSPACSSCPLRHMCRAYRMVQKEQGTSNTPFKKRQKTSVVDIECAADQCSLCLPDTQPWQTSLGVTNYPRKSKKKPPREQTSAVFVIHRTGAKGREFFLCQRPKTGLLAGLWEFPTFDDLKELQDDDALFSKLAGLGIEPSSLGHRSKVADVVHIFSHIHQTYCVESLRYSSKLPPTTTSSTSTSPLESQCAVSTQWMTEPQLSSAAISTAMRKVFKSFMEKEKKLSQPRHHNTSRSSKHKTPPNDKQSKKQKSFMDAFFKNPADK
ncbi:hypothetical protein Ahia01_000911500 [Argonauta hians]